MKPFLLLLLCFFTSGCSGPQIQPILPVTQKPVLEASELITSSGLHLPVRSWLPAEAPQAIVIGLHGMNDYSHAFAMPGDYLSRRGIALYAYDQRSFGRTAHRGIWPGDINLVSDLQDMVAVLRERYPQTPVFVLGESMGGAVAIAAASCPIFPKLNGVILSAPAVWGGAAMNPFYRASLWSFAQVFPGKILTGEGLHILASDNIPMLRELGHDPLVQKRTRVDSILGLVRLMDKGYDNLHRLRVPLLILYGRHDQVIPPEAIKGALGDANSAHSIGYYPDGYHLLLRDLHRDVPLSDIVSWIMDPAQPLPSGYDEDGRRWQKSENSDGLTPGASAFARKMKRIVK